MTELLDNIFAIPCPDTLAALNLYGDTKGMSEVRALDWRIVNGSPKTKQWNYNLPLGNWLIICQSNSATEFDATRIVERDRGGFAGNVEGYKEYFKPGDWSMDHEPFRSAIKSLQSLLKSKGLTAGNYLIIKKVEGK